MNRVFLLLTLTLTACDISLPNTCARNKEDVINFQYREIIDGNRYVCGKSKGYYCVRLCDD